MTFAIRTRLALWYSAVIAIALLLLSAVVFVLHSRWGRAQVDADLTDLSTTISQVLKEELGESGNIVHAAAEVRESLELPGRAVAILDANGDRLAGDWNGFEFDTTILPATAGQQISTLNQRGHSWRVLTRRESPQSGAYSILVGTPLDEQQRQSRELVRVLVVGTPCIVLLAALVCWWVASAALQPVTIMAAEAEAITGQSAEWRFHATGRQDEVGQLAGAFNRLLARLTNSAAAQRDFMADASHELRTPVSVIQTTAEITLERMDRTPEEYREALGIVNEQSLRLKRMVEDMLLLARADVAGLPFSAHPLSLDDVAADCVRAITVVAARSQIALTAELEPEVPVNGDARLLRQLVTNLLANAVQYTPPGGAVTAHVTSDAARGIATLTVADTGPGIPIADRERVFQRFVRLDPARSTAPGAGLGLPIARWIAEQHGGTLTMEENLGGGSRFVLTLPLYRPGARVNRNVA